VPSAFGSAVVAMAVPTFTGAEPIMPSGRAVELRHPPLIGSAVRLPSLIPELGCRLVEPHGMLVSPCGALVSLDGAPVRQPRTSYWVVRSDRGRLTLVPNNPCVPRAPSLGRTAET